MEISANISTSLWRSSWGPCISLQVIVPIWGLQSCICKNCCDSFGSGQNNAENFQSSPAAAQIPHMKCLNVINLHVGAQKVTRGYISTIFKCSDLATSGELSSPTM